MTFVAIHLFMALSLVRGKKKCDVRTYSILQNLKKCNNDDDACWYVCTGQPIRLSCVPPDSQDWVPVGFGGI